LIGFEDLADLGGGLRREHALLVADVARDQAAVLVDRAADHPGRHGDPVVGDGRERVGELQLGDRDALADRDRRQRGVPPRLVGHQHARGLPREPAAGRAAVAERPQVRLEGLGPELLRDVDGPVLLERSITLYSGQTSSACPKASVKVLPPTGRA
jgi:hypothetical protein